MADIRRWTDLTGPELTALDTDTTVAVLPVAAIEQHGPHLPLSTDVDIGEGLLAAALERVATSATVLILPTMAVAASPEHAAFAGTLSLTPEAAIDQLVALGDGVARAGIRRLVICNSHGGNKAVIDIAALKLRAVHDQLVVKAHYFRFGMPSGVLPEDEYTHGLHGGALETSLMMYLAPERVRRAALARFETIGQRRAGAGWRVLPEGEAAFAWLAQDLNPAGVAGNSRQASSARGERLCDHFASRLAAIIDETAVFDPISLAPPRSPDR